MHRLDLGRNVAFALLHALNQFVIVLTALPEVLLDLSMISLDPLPLITIIPLLIILKRKKPHIPPPLNPTPHCSLLPLLLHPNDAAFTPLHRYLIPHLPPITPPPPIPLPPAFLKDPPPCDLYLNLPPLLLRYLTALTSSSSRNTSWVFVNSLFLRIASSANFINPFADTTLATNTLDRNYALSALASLAAVVLEPNIASLPLTGLPNAGYTNAK